MRNSCDGPLHPKAIQGLELFNAGKFFEAHEGLEEAWREEAGEIRSLYKGILQAAVAYHHVLHKNFDGALKVYGRSIKWLNSWPGICRGVRVGKLKEDLGNVMMEVRRLGRTNLGEFDPKLIRQIEWAKGGKWVCDRCGGEMIESNCKITCPNCGNRFDCSDLNLYFD